MKQLSKEATIHFSSSKTQTISVEKFLNFPVELNKRGVKTMRDDNDERQLLIPLNSNTIEFIECLYEEIEEEVKPEPTEEEILKEIAAEAEEAKAEVESKKDLEEKRKDAEREFMEKANCTHPAEKQEIWKKLTGNGVRYMPVCSTCGKRERYVKADSLPDEVKANAKILED